MGWYWHHPRIEAKLYYLRDTMTPAEFDSVVDDQIYEINHSHRQRKFKITRQGLLKAAHIVGVKLRPVLHDTCVFGEHSNSAIIIQETYTWHGCRRQLRNLWKHRIWPPTSTHGSYDAQSMH